MFVLVSLKCGPKIVKSDVNLNFIPNQLGNQGSGDLRKLKSMGRGVDEGYWGGGGGECESGKGGRDLKSAKLCLYTLFRSEGISNSSVSSFQNKSLLFKRSRVRKGSTPATP